MGMSFSRRYSTDVDNDTDKSQLYKAQIRELSHDCDIYYIHIWNLNKKDRWDSENPARQQTPFCDVQMVVILLVANTSISIPYRYPTTENLSDLDFDLSRSLKVKSDGVIRLAI